MPSFATEVKNEIARRAVKKQCCQRAELSALLRSAGEIAAYANGSIGVRFATENAAVGRRVLLLLKEAGQLHPAVTVSRDKRLKKQNRYVLRVPPALGVKALLEQLGLQGAAEQRQEALRQMLRRQCCRRAYLRGAFLGGSTVNRPEREASLEFIAYDYDFAHTLLRILRNMDFPAGITDRKNRFQIYLKDGEEIINLLDMLGARTAAEELEVARNLREVRNQVNRVVNCETANLQRTVAASLEQVKAIEKLQAAGKLAMLSTKLQDTAKARAENPQESLAELGQRLGLSRSAVKSRLNKLLALSREL